MPYSVLLLLLFLWSCRDRTDDAAPIFHDEIERAPVLACTEHDALAMPGAAAELSASGDTAVVALFADARTVLLMDDALRVRARVELAQHGPDGIADPVSVIAEGDSLVIADAEAQQISVFDWSGTRLSSMATEFAPLQLVRAGDRIAIAPAVVGRFPGTLLFTLRAGRVQREEVGVVEFPDLTTKALGNRVRLLPSPAALIVLHQFFTPRALRISSREQRTLRVPLARGMAGTLGYIPPLPLNDEALEPALVVANDAAPAGSNEFLLLVRTGRRASDRFEKAVLRTDSLLQLKAAYRLPISPGLMSYLPRSRTAVLVDEEDRWYTCKLP
jgi:hypothetical protein